MTCGSAETGMFTRLSETALGKLCNAFQISHLNIEIDGFLFYHRQNLRVVHKQLSINYGGN